MKKKNTLTPLFIIILISFSCYYFYDTSTSLRIPEKSTYYFSSQLTQREEIVKKILNESTKILEANKESSALFPIEDYYSYDEIGVYSNHTKTLKSNSYITKGTIVDNKLKKYLAITDYLEKIWVKNKKEYGNLIMWQYTYHLSSNTIRLYPWSDFSKMFGSRASWSLVKFLNSMSVVKKFDNSIFCTRPNNDDGGTGIGLSCCKIFNQSQVYSDVIVSCVDISLRDLLHDLRRSLLSENIFSDKILIKSYSEVTTYPSDLIIDLSDGSIKQENGIISDLDKYKVLYDKTFHTLKITVKIVTKK